MALAMYAVSFFRLAGGTMSGRRDVKLVVGVAETQEVSGTTRLGHLISLKGAFRVELLSLFKLK